MRWRCCERNETSLAACMWASEHSPGPIRLLIVFAGREAKPRQLVRHRRRQHAVSRAGRLHRRGCNLSGNRLALQSFAASPRSERHYRERSFWLWSLVGKYPGPICWNTSLTFRSSGAMAAGDDANSAKSQPPRHNSAKHRKRWSRHPHSDTNLAVSNSLGRISL